MTPNFIDCCTCLLADCERQKQCVWTRLSLWWPAHATLCQGHHACTLAMHYEVWHHVVVACPCNTTLATMRCGPKQFWQPVAPVVVANQCTICVVLNQWHKCVVLSQWHKCVVLNRWHQLWPTSGTCCGQPVALAVAQLAHIQCITL
jgi:hypothetical protein